MGTSTQKLGLKYGSFCCLVKSIVLAGRLRVEIDCKTRLTTLIQMQRELDIHEVLAVESYFVTDASLLETNRRVEHVERNIEVLKCLLVEVIHRLPDLLNITLEVATTIHVITQLIAASSDDHLPVSRRIVIHAILSDLLTNGFLLLFTDSLYNLSLVFLECGVRQSIETHHRSCTTRVYRVNTNDAGCRHDTTNNGGRVVLPDKLHLFLPSELLIGIKWIFNVLIGSIKELLICDRLRLECKIYSRCASCYRHTREDKRRVRRDILSDCTRESLKGHASSPFKEKYERPCRRVSLYYLFFLRPRRFLRFDP